MKKIIIALLCAFTLFAFASCSGDTPAPDTGEKQYLENIPSALYGKWKNTSGQNEGWIISEDDVVYYSNFDGVGFSYNQSMYRDEDNGAEYGYCIRQSGVTQALFQFKYSESGKITVVSYDDATDTKAENTYKLVKE